MPSVQEELVARDKRSGDFQKHIKGAYSEAQITPHWVEKSSTFWYRWTVGLAATFVLVNAEKGVRNPAFDHKGLARALHGHGIEATATKLPFVWIEPDASGTSVKFRIKETVWEFMNNRILTECPDGKIYEERLEPLWEETPSETTGPETSIIFLNQMKFDISLFWINYTGKAVFYLTIKAGQSYTQQTYEGHVFRLAKSDTDDRIVSFMAEPDESRAVIEEGMAPKMRPAQESTEATQIASDSSAEETRAFSEVFVRDYNVSFRDVDGHETQLSTSGTKENPIDGDAVYLSPDARFAVLYQYTPESKHTVYEVESSPKNQIQPLLKEFQYLKPGDNVRVDRPRLFDLYKEKEISTDESLFQNPYEILDMGWNADSSEYYFYYNQRGHQIIRVLGMNVEGSVRTLVEERSKTFIDYETKRYWHLLKKSPHLIWTSERSGWNSLYLFDLKKGAIENQITRGEWVVRSVERVDEESKQIWLTALGIVKGQDPYYAQLVKVNFDGTDLTILTDGDGTHTWNWSPDRRYLIDTWSRVDSPPKIVLRDGSTGKHIIPLEEGSMQQLLDRGWTVPERLSAPGRDNKILIYGIIIKPSDFNPNQKYPVIEEIYAGPSDTSVPKAFSTLSQQHALAELGFIVVMIDGMGTNWRSKPFHDICYKNLKDAGLPDRIAWMKAAATSRPWMDLERVGIYGGSAGGQNAMAALLWHGDFYKAAVADCGCHDNRMDKLWWNEQWMGWPVDKSYEDCSNVVHAHRLRGALMLIVGELDENVDPASTMQVVNALNRAGKDYELVFFPGAGHGVGSSSRYAVRRQRDFFVRHLLGVEPLKRNG